MSVQDFAKRDIALAQLETSLRLYFEGGDLFSVITLAGAAEEILGQLVRKAGKTNSLDTLQQAATAIYLLLNKEAIPPKEFAQRANRAKNALKHHDPGASATIAIDPLEEAVDLLDRAVLNYWLLEQNVTPAMKEFTEWHRFSNPARRERPRRTASESSGA